MTLSIWIGIFLSAAGAGETTDATVPADARVVAAKDGLAEAERRQREVLAHIFTLGREIKDAVKRSGDLTRRSLGLDGDARTLAGEVRELETKSAERGRLLNKRLNSLYRRRASTSALETLFSSTSPAALDRHRRFLRLMIEDDHRQMDAFVAGLREAKQRRQHLNHVVRRLVGAKRDARVEEARLERQMAEKARLVAELRRASVSSLETLSALREAGAVGEFAFFEKRGRLPAPVAGPVTRDFGAYVDPEFGFKLMHKGWFFARAAGTPIAAVAAGTVGVARTLPGWGPTVVVDHGDHYYSVYAGGGRIKVREGARVAEGDVIGATSDRAPLFGPGVYFELRHFADAIDPRNWIKDPEFRTAERE